MKLEYDVKNDDRECVAYIDKDGDLKVKGESESENICLRIDCKNHFSDAYFDPADWAKHKFYPGDKLTITF